MPRAPLMLRESDAERIEMLRRQLRAESKVSVVRQALDLLEQEIDRQARIARWRRAAAVVAKQSAKANRELRTRHPALDDE